MKAVVIGPGRIGCGFAGHVLRESGYDVVFLARSPIMVKHLNRVRRYRLLLYDSHRTEDILVEGVRAVGVFAPARAAREIAEADVIVTAVGASNLPDVAPLIAAGLRRRTTPANVLAFENMRHASRRLRELVMEHWEEPPNGVEHGLSGGLVERVVAKRLGEPEADQPLVFLGDASASFRVDGARLVPPLPAIKGMILSDQYEAWMKRKLYTYSAGHATAAYLGSLKGYHYIHTAIRDREIRAAVLAAMAEGQRGLAARYGPEISGDKRDLLEIISRFENATFGDRIQRVGRDPMRKLGVDERLVGAAQLAQRAGIPPRNLSLAAAAALCFVDPDDPSAAVLGREIEHEGPAKAIQRVCGLRPDLGLGKLVHEDCNRLLTGRNGGGLLLHLGSDMWSCGDHVHATWAGNGKHGGGEIATNGSNARSEPAGNGKDLHVERAGNGTDGHGSGHGHGKGGRAPELVPARPHGPPSPRSRPRPGGGLKLFFMLVRRVPPVSSPVLVEVFDLLGRRGFQVDSGIAEEMVQRPDELAVEHDLFILKSHTELSLSLAGALHSQGARLLNPYPSCVAVQNKIVASRLLRAAGIPAPDCWVTGDLKLLRDVVADRPVIIKPYLGHRGQGLRIVRNPEELSSVPPPETPVLVQEFIEGSAEDLKVYVVGQEVFAVRKPFSPTSFTESGRPSPVDPEVRKIALRCGEALGLGLYGMDLVESKGRVWVVDVNTFPGYKGVPKVAPRIAEYIESFAMGRVTLASPVRRHPRRTETSRVPSTENHAAWAAGGTLHGA